MKKCKNCIYHDSKDGECIRLLSMVAPETDTCVDTMYELSPALEVFESGEDLKSEEWIDIMHISEFTHRSFRFITPDWFRCVFHVKKVDDV